MYKVTKRDCPMFGIGPYVCEFICDTASDITTLPTSISEGTGGRTAYDNQKCASGSIAIVASESESKQYMLNNQDIWCPYSVAAGSSSGGSGESSITVDFALSETSENPVANKVIAAALNEKADTTHTHTANEVGADTSGSAASALEEAKAYTDSEIGQAVGTLESALNEKANIDDLPDLSAYALKSKYGDTTIDVGRKEGTNVGIRSTAEGQDTTASNACSHAEGSNTVASQVCSHAEGAGTVASGVYSHSEGNDTTASGIRSHAGGGSSVASGDSSFAHGKNVQALHDHEVALGQYNKSSSYTLFSVGDGDSDTARHNAFEITTTGGKIHDKNIATTDLIPDLSAYAKTADVPNIKVNSAVGADNVGGIVPRMLFCHREGPSSRDLNECVELGSYFFNGIDANAPASTSGVLKQGTYAIVYNIIKEGFIHQLCHIIHGSAAQLGRMFVRYYDKVLNSWSEWKENYTEAGKPYITGDTTVAANSGVCVTNHGFTPSAVIWWDGSSSGVAVSFNETQFVMNSAQTTNRTVNYLIFK